MGGHHQRRGSAVGDGDDALVPLHILSVDLWHHQRHVGFHAEGRAVVDDHRACAHGVGSQFAADRGAGRDERDVHAFEGLLRGFLDYQFLAANRDALAGRALGRHQPQAGRLGVALLDDAQELCAHGSGCANYGNGQVFHGNLFLLVIH